MRGAGDGVALGGGGAWCCGVPSPAKAKAASGGGDAAFALGNP
ncbi:hypothetical protein [Lentzea indica]|nr:hypothetical protein [Lentzea indica]